MPLKDDKHVSQLARALTTYRPGDQPALPLFLPQLCEILGADKAITYGISPREHGVALSLFEVAGLEPAMARSLLEDRLKRELPSINTIEERPINRKPVPGFRELRRMAAESGAMLLDRIVPALGLDGYDQLRARICNAPRFLAWVGAFRITPFTASERDAFLELLPALRQRITLEQQLAESALNIPALAAAMEALRSPAYILAAGGVVKLANSAGKALMDIEPKAMDWLLSSLRDPDRGKFALTRLLVPRCEHHLAVMRKASNDPVARLALATVRWDLTSKQTEVLSWIVRGESSKAIASALDCAEGTVELHVAAVLHKSKAEKRSELIAKFWMEL